MSLAVGRRSDDMLMVWLKVLLAGCLASANTQTSRQKVIDAQTRFGLQMFSMIGGHEAHGNLMISPSSVGSALALVYAGSRGRTLQQMQQVLQLNGTRLDALRGHRALLMMIKRRFRTNSTSVFLTNHIYVSRTATLRQRYKDRVRKNLKVSPKRLNFFNARRSAAIINRRASKDTDGNIKDVVDSDMLTSLTRLVIVSAVYFRGTWASRFREEATSASRFNTPEGPISVSMMENMWFYPVANHPDLGARLVLLPYTNRRLVMGILLPYSGQPVQRVIEKLAKKPLNLLLDSVSSSKKVKLRIPRFSVQFSADLQPVLTQMGMSDVFDKHRSNLKGISPNDLYITNAVHRCVVEVNEQGAEASGATVITLGNRMLEPNPRPFIVDRPFVMFIADYRTSALLFIGRISNPTNSTAR